MMTEPDELSQHTLASIFRHINWADSTTRPESKQNNNVVFAQADFECSKSFPVPEGFTNIQESITEHEKNPTRKAALARARAKIADDFYSNKISVAALRLQKGWSQRELAEHMNTSQPHVARIESGREDVRMSTIKKLATALDTNVENIFSALDSGQ